MLALDLFENKTPLTLMDGFRKLLPIAVKHLNLPHLPKIHLKKEQAGTHQASFGGYDPETDEIHLTISNRHPVDVLRTLAHELVHYKQKLDGKLVDDSWKTGSPAENEANSEAGIILRLFNKQCPEFMNVKPIVDEVIQGVAENFADGKKPGRKGLAKRMGVPTDASVTRLRQIAKNSSGEKQRMAHWMANMKGSK
tara:strand:+ start:195 stop:782 length:588 start_codon:yes stop_codon:yes gene_type:complete